jgi:hypothetical protein
MTLFDREVMDNAPGKDQTHVSSTIIPIIFPANYGSEAFSSQSLLYKYT